MQFFFVNAEKLDTLHREIPYTVWRQFICIVFGTFYRDNLNGNFFLWRMKNICITNVIVIC